jgi:AraC family transcriptional regulator, activator of mtrCDE
VNPAQSFDTLSGLAPLLRVRPQLQQLCRFGAQWAADHPPEPDRWAPFHFLVKGSCVIELRDRGRMVALSAGDIAVLPHGSPHAVRGPTTPAGARGPFGIRKRPLGAIELETNVEGDGETELICGRLCFEVARENLVLAALPEIIVTSTGDDDIGGARLRMLMSAIHEELQGVHAGAEAIATDLASALFVMVVRIQLGRDGRGGCLSGTLAHPQIGRAVAAMLDDPARDWTLDELAACAHASRASFVRMFRKSAQRSPLAFLAELRLELAQRKLSASTLPVARIAGEVGYRSESAFSRAFHRRFGLRPGEVRTAVSRTAPAMIREAAD